MRINVAIVIPEIGFDEDPMRPVMREDTVEKKNAKTTISSAARMLPRSGMFGATARKSASSSDPISTTLIGISRSVRSPEAPLAAPNPFSPSSADRTIVGIVRASVMSPPASTAPAPM